MSHLFWLDQEHRNRPVSTAFLTSLELWMMGDRGR